MSRSRQRRIIRRALISYTTSRPHEAWTILADAGLADMWPTFLRTALRLSRRRFVTRMEEYQ